MLQLVKTLVAELDLVRSELELEKIRSKNFQLVAERAQQEWERTFDAVDDYILWTDKDRRILRINRAASRAFDVDPCRAKGGYCYNVLHRRPRICRDCPTTLVLEDNNPHTIEYENRRMGRNFLITVSPVFHASAGLTGVFHVTKDITEKKPTRNDIKLAYDEMGKTVKERTAQLECKSRSLEEANTALRLMLKAREEDRKELGEKVISNIKHLLLPYVDMLKNSSLSPSQLEWLETLRVNMEQIISPFVTTLSEGTINLTPKEIETANLVKNGKSNKEIAAMLGVSLRAIEFHRENIRKKLGLKNKKTNLRSYLLSLQ